MQFPTFFKCYLIFLQNFLSIFESCIHEESKEAIDLLRYQKYFVNIQKYEFFTISNIVKILFFLNENFVKNFWN